MPRFNTCLGSVVTLLLSAAAASANCTPDEQHRLLTGTFYREAEPARAAHASIMSVIATRMNMPKWPDTLCEVITQPDQFNYEIEGTPDEEKYAIAEDSAVIFLAEMPDFVTEGAVFERLKGLDSFNMEGATPIAPQQVIAGNGFYNSNDVP